MSVYDKEFLDLLRAVRDLLKNSNTKSITGLITQGTNVTITGSGTIVDPYVISSTTSGGSTITIVPNYSALPTPSTVSGQFYWVSNSQGTRWLPGTLGGTYYNSGLYYSNGTTWESIETPYQATQAEVNTGTNTDKFVTPSTLRNSTQFQYLDATSSIQTQLNNKFTLPALTNGSILFSNGTTISQNNPIFFWDNTNSILYNGANSGGLSNSRFAAYGNVNSSLQNTIINNSSGVTASTDFVGTANTGTNTTNYINLGINSSGFTGNTNWGNALDGYAYVNGGNMWVGTDTNNNLNFVTGGGLDVNIRGFVDGLGRWNIGSNIAIGSGIQNYIGGTITTGVTVINLTGGATTNASKIITYTANTVVKRGDAISGTNIQNNTVIDSITSSTSATISLAATGTTSGLTFLVGPNQTGLYINPTITGNSSARSTGTLFTPMINSSSFPFAFQILPTFFNCGQPYMLDLSQFSITGTTTTNPITLRTPILTIFQNPTVNYLVYDGANSNMFLGASANTSVTGSLNYTIGSSAGINLAGGSANIFIGRAAGRAITSGNQNVFIGDWNNINAGASSVSFSSMIGFSGPISLSTGLNPVNNNSVFILSANDDWSVGGGSTGSNQYIFGGFLSGRDFFFGGNTFAGTLLTGYQNALTVNFGKINSSITFVPSGVSFASGVTAGTPITVTGTGNVSVGDSFSGTGIPANTTITAFVSLTSYTLSNTTTAASSGTYTVTKNNISGSSRSITTFGAQASGNALAGDLIYSTYVAGSSGSTPQTAQDVLRITATQRVGIGNIGFGNVTALLHVGASTTSAASLRLVSGTAPSVPNNGDIWNDGSNLSLNGIGISLLTIGAGYRIKEGSNARLGLATLVSGTITINNTSITANTRIFLSVQANGAYTGRLRETSRVNGTSFTIGTGTPTDTCDFVWVLIEGI